jgi:murein DD-endopeptidase MepM/ murein hydrolase activator NlpD
LLSRIRLLLVVAVLPLVLWAALPLVSAAGPQASLSSLQNRIDAKRQRLAKVHGHAHVLTSDISSLTHRIGALQGTVDTLQHRQDAIQADLDVQQRQLAATQTELRAARAQLARSRAQLARARKVLAARLVALYKSDAPDIVTVVLNAKGFEQLLENGTYLHRIGAQDREIVTAVKLAKARAAAAAKRLGTLEASQQRITTQIADHRNAVARVRLDVQGHQDVIAGVRADKRALLHRVNAQAGKISEDIAAMQRQQNAIAAKLNGAGNGGIAPGPIHGGGRFIWPVNGPITSPFCERRAWEACHPGIDIGVPSGTPIRAAGTGTVAIAGWVSGYGNYTCINHGGGLSTCYGHQSRLEVSVGQHVTVGQVIGLSGCTGLCFGPHVHFEVRINGAVTNPVNYLG